MDFVQWNLRARNFIVSIRGLSVCAGEETANEWSGRWTPFIGFDIVECASAKNPRFQFLAEAAPDSDQL